MSENTAKPTTDLDDDLDLVYVRDIRKRITTKLMEKGLPEDSDDRKLLVQMLDGISRDALTKKRIKSDAKSAGGLADAVGLVTEFLNRAKPTAITPPANPAKPPPILGAELPRPNLVAGELSETVSRETYYEFAQRTGLEKSANASVSEDPDDC